MSYLQYFSPLGFLMGYQWHSGLFKSQINMLFSPYIPVRFKGVFMAYHIFLRFFPLGFSRNFSLQLHWSQERFDQGGVLWNGVSQQTPLHLYKYISEINEREGSPKILFICIHILTSTKQALRMADTKYWWMMKPELVSVTKKTKIEKKKSRCVAIVEHSI